MFVQFKEGFGSHIPNYLSLDFFCVCALMTDFKVVPGSGRRGILHDTEAP